MMVIVTRHKALLDLSQSRLEKQAFQAKQLAKEVLKKELGRNPA